MTGQPGIGKTTLARMLLADAVHDGYEPIEISADIDEAHGTLHPSKPQVFYYDDFLGSTFLQDRLAKNEDKRLTAFMRQCLQSNKTLFILTTREHILTQATQWYEELHRSALPLKRLILELSDYTRLDRARIFYNHAWRSGQLSIDSRRLLARDRNYNNIIDHPNYNPRLIEYVTGLASRKLSPDDNADYVKFAVEVLDNPDLIWQRAFEQQLDDSCKDILVALASMPTSTTLEDLQQAFVLLGSAHRHSQRRGAFRDSIEVLDDTFTRSWEGGGKIFVDMANPSIRDFVAAWLSQHPEEIPSTVSGCFFFEQLDWFTSSVLDGPYSNALVSSIAEVVERSYAARNPAWRNVYFDDEPTPRFTRDSRTKEDRLIYLLRLMSEDPSLRRRLQDWFDQRILELQSEWLDFRRFESDPSKPVSLIQALKEAGRLDLRTAETARRCLQKHQPYTYKWSQLARLRALVPDAFPAHVAKKLTAQMREWAAEVLASDFEEIGSSDEIGEIGVVATSFGVFVDPDVLESARSTIYERNQAEAEDAFDEEVERESDELSAVKEDAAIEQLFSRLATEVGDGGS
nr:hypothetical protein [Actinoplanes bogorensis]